MPPRAFLTPAATERVTREDVKSKKKEKENRILHSALLDQQVRKRWCKMHGLAILAGQLDLKQAFQERKETRGVESFGSPASQVLGREPSRMMLDDNGEFLQRSTDADAPRDRDQMTEYEKFREATWQLWSVPESSVPAFLISTFILILILISSTTFCLETMQEFDDPTSQSFFEISEYVSIACFTLEFVLRVWSAPSLPAFAKSIMNQVDFIAILPFYVELLAAGVGGISGTRVLRIIRLVRVFRILKLGGRFSKMQVVGGAVFDSMDMLGMLVFLLLLSMILFSTLIYFCEKGNVPEGVEDQFRSIPSSFWWCIVTLMTVGYGDAVPQTVWGQLVATMTMLASIIILALPISVIGANFTDQWMRFRDQQKMKEQAMNLRPNFEHLVRALVEHNSVCEELLQEIRIIEQNLARVLSNIRAELTKHDERVRLGRRRKRNSKEGSIKPLRPSLKQSSSLKRSSLDANQSEILANSNLEAVSLDELAAKPDAPAPPVGHLGTMKEDEVMVEEEVQLEEEDDSPGQLDMHFNYAQTLKDMLEERIKQLSLVSSEEFTTLLQSCQKSHKTKDSKKEEGRTIQNTVFDVKKEVEEIQRLFDLDFNMAAIPRPRTSFQKLTGTGVEKRSSREISNRA